MIPVILFVGIVSSAFASALIAPNNCTVNQFSCTNGNCIPSSLRCNEKNDCGDASDEEMCDLILCKPPNYFRCNNSKRCISKSWVCDGEDDCVDASDELNCPGEVPKPITCNKYEWKCMNKRSCISIDDVCNGEPDCSDGSDEVIGCTLDIECDKFKCKNGHCIGNEWICDGYDDCGDKSDEEDCEHHFDIQRCNIDERKFLCSDNKTCIDDHQVCDGHIDCPDKSDEGFKCTLKNASCLNHGCSHDCVLLPTGPKCVCPVGYHNIDEKNCYDINECERYGICDQKCQNTPGSYRCYCDPKYSLQSDERSCKANGGEAMLIFSSKSNIRAYTLQSHLYFSVAKRLKQVIGVDYDGHHIYWTDIFAEHESIVRSLEDGSEKEVLVTSGLGLPEDLAVDWLTGNIYFTDTEKQHIGVCTENGEYCTVLVNKDIRRPRAIVLNVEEGDMYWTDWGQPAEIAHSLMDGTGDESFVSNNVHWPNGLALDYPNERLYWTDARKMTLESIRLDGTDRRIVLDQIVKHPYAIAVFENQLYWSDWVAHSIQSCDKFYGKNHSTVIKESKAYIYGISIFHPALQNRNENPCDGAFCSDICLLKGDGYSCACPQNKVLSYDKHVCRDVKKKQMLIIGFKNTLIEVEHQLLGKHDVSTITSPAKNIGCLAFNNINNTLLISDLDTKSIISTNLDTGFSEVLDIHDLGEVSAMDYDPMGNNLYMCDEEKKILEVVNLNTMSRKILLHDMNGESVQSITLIPDEGVMFISLKKDQISHIDRLTMDGMSRTHVVEQGLVGPVTVYYDNDVHRVFFADAGTGNIESTSVEGDDRHGFRSLSAFPVGLTSLEYDIFWVNDFSKTLYWAEKNSTTNYKKKITFDIPGNVEKLHLTSITHKRHYHSVCQYNNGNCSHLCLMSYKSAVCACPNGWDLSSDNHTCIKREHCSSTEFLCQNSNVCILSSLRCNGRKDCSFGEDEIDCEPSRKCAPDLFQCNNGECIQQEKLCDHNYDCKDKSDEYNCQDKNKKKSCPPRHFSCGDGKCIPNIYLCNGIFECADHSDEEKCSVHMCGSQHFRCNSGTCIPKSWECDHEYDCSDYSDEHAQCPSVTCSPTMHTCSNGKCIDKKLVCDKSNDCGDNSDELMCDLATTGGCRLNEFACSSNSSICVLNSAKCNGTSECPHHEDEKDCSDCNVDEFSCDNKKCIPVQWICDGVNDCGDNTDEKRELCSHSLDGTLQFSANSCENGFRCKSGHCISLSSVCDGKHDCYDDSDENGLCPQACEAMKHTCSQVCVPTPTGPLCKCNPGYKLMGDGRTCKDLDECQIDPPVCSQICNNNEASFTCDCFNGYLLRSDKKSCKAEGPPMSLIFTSNNQIRKLTQKTNSLTVIFSNEMPKISGLDFVQRSKSIYFSIELTGTIHRISEEKQIREYIEHVGQPQKLSVDWPTQNLYFYNADTRSNSINVCNFEERLCAKLLDIDIHRQVSAITVDSVNKVMFYSVMSWWTFDSPSYVLYKCHLDGSGRTEVVKFTSGYITGLAFDYNNKRLYFVDQHNSQIGMVNYEGKMKTVLFTTETQPIGLKFFEDHLFYLTNGGYIFKCKLFENRNCVSFKINSYTTDLFTVVQETLQPSVENVCKNHTCSYLCLTSEPQYKCLCKNGDIVAKSEECRDVEGKSDFKVHSVSVKQEELNGKKGNSAVIIGILIPIFIILVLTVATIIIRRKNNGSMNVSIRFYNPESSTNSLHNDEKPILQPGQHEYINPVHFDENRSEMSPSLARKLNEMGGI